MRLIEKVWFQQHSAKYWLIPLLLPLSGIFYLLSTCRRLLYRAGIFKSYNIDKPVIVVGNIGVGGNGKTPVVVYLVELLQKLGFKPGVISRGYGGKAASYPFCLDSESTPEQAGDEPVLIYNRCHIPVVVGSDRVANANMLVGQGCDVIISDDGLQHYRLQRDIELVIIDAKRLFGNGLLLPSGPLRERTSRIQSADLVIYNGQLEQTAVSNNQSLGMNLAAKEIVNITTGEKIVIDVFLSKWPAVNAIAGIGDPQRFFDTLQSLNFTLIEQQGFVDHKNFQLDDFNQIDSDLPLLMTEKDAVKCQVFAQDNWWYLPVNAQLSAQDQQVLLTCIKNKILL